MSEPGAHTYDELVTRRFKLMPHVAKLIDYVERLKQTHPETPYFDPCEAGTNARGAPGIALGGAARACRHASSTRRSPALTPARGAAITCAASAGHRQVVKALVDARQAAGLEPAGADTRARCAWCT